MCLCDLLLAGAMETFSPKSDDIAWKSIAHQKQIAISSCSSSEIVLLLNFKMIQLYFFEQQGAKKKAGRCSILTLQKFYICSTCLLSVGKPLKSLA